MSTASNASMMSVSVFGEEIDVNKGVDLVFRDLQDSLNQCHCSIRNLIQCDDRGDSYIESCEIQNQVSEYIVDFSILMKELKSLSVELLGKCPKDEKAEYTQWKEQIKIKNDADKAERLTKRLSEMGV